MQCPSCRGALIEERQYELLIDRCSSCGGIWFDGSELEAYRSQHPELRAKAAHRWSPAELSGAEALPYCPRCNDQPLSPGEIHNLPAYRCDRCHGLFLKMTNSDDTRPPATLVAMDVAGEILASIVGSVLDGL